MCRLWTAALMGALLSGAGIAYAQGENAEVIQQPAKYRTTRVHLLPGPVGPQTGVSRGYVIVNFGSRDGVRRGSVFNVKRGEILVGQIRVDRVWRDSSRASILRLRRKSDPASPRPMEAGYLLEPHYVLLETIQFDLGKPSIDPEMYRRLHYAARFIHAYPAFPLIMEGHTDNTGSAKDNQKLSEARAEQIRFLLHEVHRLPDTQMHVKGYGESDPVASNATEWGRRQNRRVDIILAGTLPD
jgi:outer membrane protein OmpA-like peptidoglycan-associated protein